WRSTTSRSSTCCSCARRSTKARMRLTIVVAALSLGALAAACGGATVGPTAPGEKQMAWKDMNKDQRKQYMRKVVFPKMAQDFASFDAKKYGDMTCETCHGDGA